MPSWSSRPSSLASPRSSIDSLPDAKRSAPIARAITDTFAIRWAARFCSSIRRWNARGSIRRRATCPPRRCSARERMRSAPGCASTTTPPAPNEPEHDVRAPARAIRRSARAGADERLLGNVLEEARGVSATHRARPAHARLSAGGPSAWPGVRAIVGRGRARAGSRSRDTRSRSAAASSRDRLAPVARGASCRNSRIVGYHGVLAPCESQRKSGGWATSIQTGLPIVAAMWASAVSTVTSKSTPSSTAIASSSVSSAGPMPRPSPRTPGSLRPAPPPVPSAGPRTAMPSSVEDRRELLERHRALA